MKSALLLAYNIDLTQSAKVRWDDTTVYTTASLACCLFLYRNQIFIYMCGCVSGNHEASDGAGLALLGLAPKDCQGHMFKASNKTRSRTIIVIDSRLLVEIEKIISDFYLLRLYIIL